MNCALRQPSDRRRGKCDIMGVSSVTHEVRKDSVSNEHPCRRLHAKFISGAQIAFATYEYPSTYAQAHQLTEMGR